MKVICKLKNASSLINSVKFAPQENVNGDETTTVMVSEDVSEEVAKAFASINGYAVLDESKETAKPKKTATSTAPATP